MSDANYIPRICIDFEAVQYDGSNGAALAELLAPVKVLLPAGYATPGLRAAIAVQCQEQILVCEPGDYIVRYADGTLAVVAQQAFEVAAKKQVAP
jgi:hypothetical protein